jgi:membrane-associated phospholipid phosphatase
LTSPLRIRRSDAKWLVPLAAATAALIATDTKASGALSDSTTLRDTSRRVSAVGSPLSAFGAAGALYAIGKITDDDRLRETGVLGVEALIHSQIVISGLKFATNRERPDKIQTTGGFYDGGKSFASGHAISIWALSTVVAEEYHDKPLIRFGAYGLAAAVSASRFTGRNHYPSDVLVGSALGYLIGKYIVNRHSGFKLGGSITTVTPQLDRASRSVGAGLTLQY